MSVNSLKARNNSLNHIFNNDKLLICLVCKENIKGKRNCHHDILVSRHINSIKHQKNVRSLFHLCVPNWKGVYAKIVQNLVFDVALERNESSFVSKTGNDFTCLVCQENIAQGTDPKEIISFIINHIQTDFHWKNFKDGVSWVHTLGDRLDFIMIHKNEVYCSICKQNIQNEIHCPLKRAVKHLEELHIIDYQMLIKQQYNLTLTDGNSICQSLEYLTLSDSNLPRAQSSSSHGDLDSKLLLDACKFKSHGFGHVEDPDRTSGESVTDEFGNCLDSENNSDDSECELYELEDLVGSIKSGRRQNDSVDSCVDVSMCPECGEIIEIYNENADFSMDLHMQIHKPLASVNTESSFDYQDNADYVCQICQETIQVFNKDVNLSISHHFEEKHEHERFTSADDDRNRFDFLSRVFDSLPEDMRNQQSVFLVDANEVVCQLCNCVLTSSKHVPDARKVFTDHILSTFHVGQFKASSQFLTSTVLNYNKLSFCQENAYDQNYIFTNLCKQNPEIESNKQFLEKRQIDYYCTVCDKYILYSPNEKTQRFSFVLHLNSEPHKVCVKLLGKRQKADESSLNLQQVDNEREEKINILQLSNKFPLISINQAFLEEMDGGFFCEICQVVLPIKRDTNYKEIRLHCASLLHNTELLKRTLHYLSQQDHQKLTSKHINVLRSLSGVNKFKPHVHFLNHNGRNFCCIICNVPIPGSASTGKNVPAHFLSIEHREKFFDIIRSHDHSPAELTMHR